MVKTMRFSNRWKMINWINENIKPEDIISINVQCATYDTYWHLFYKGTD